MVSEPTLQELLDECALHKGNLRKIISTLEAAEDDEFKEFVSTLNYAQSLLIMHRRNLRHVQQLESEIRGK